MKPIYLKYFLSFVFVGVMAMMYVFLFTSFTLRNNLQHQNN